MEFPEDESYSKKNFSNFFFLFIFHAVKRQKRTVRRRTVHTQKQNNCMNERTRKRNKSVNEHENACALRVWLFLLATKDPSELQSLNASHIHMWNYIFPISSLISPSSLFSLPHHTSYPKTSPLGLKGAFSRLLETASEGPALGQWWLRWRGAGGAGTHSILNLLAELGRPRTEPESQIWGMPWRDGWAWGLGGQGEALAHPKTPSCLCSYANASRHFDAPQVCCLSPSFQSTPPCLTNCTYTHTHTFPPALMNSLFSPQSLPLSDLSSFFPHCVCFIWCQHIKVPNHQSKRVRDFFWGPSIQLRQPYARKATANHNVGYKKSLQLSLVRWFLLLHRMKLRIVNFILSGNRKF